ncbi:MAG: aryl-sulfate sulfotransferase, partial [Dehalococcoidia bacterium]|nr:aryl-sulfate sulfotransferase [Dehalococcoidia bacterium]
VEVNPSTNEIVWEYKSDPPSDFYSAIMGGCQRLPNGNTLICEALMGRVFEVTYEGEMVWEYILPFYCFGDSPGEYYKEWLNALFRAHRYAPDYPGLKGRDLQRKKLDVVNRIYGPEAFKKESKPDAQQTVTIRKPGLTYNGYTLFSPLGGKDAWLVDMQGNVAHRWEMPYPPGLHGELLPNGNLLYAGRVNDAPLPDFEGAGGILLEVDWNGNTLWKYEDKYMHHGFYRMRNGNTMIFKWVPVPEDIAAKVNGGLAGSELNGVMWTDAIQEINARGKVLWEWLAYEHLDPVADFICPLCPRSEWTHINGCSIMADGNILVSFSRLHNLAIIDRASGKIKWMWGRGEIAHQNNPTPLANGNILLLDNGLHCDDYSMAFSRALEINPQNNEMVWEYEDKLRANFYSSIMGSCQRLPNGNTLICETTTGRIFEVTSGQDIVWEFTSPLFYQSHAYGRNNYVARAYRYGIDYAGLRGAKLEPSVTGLDKYVKEATCKK